MELLRKSNDWFANITPKIAITLGVIALAVALFGQYIYYRGESRLYFFNNGIPMAGAEMTLKYLDHYNDEEVYELDAQGGHYFGWSLSWFQKKEKWVSVTIKDKINGTQTCVMRVPSGSSKSLDFLPGSMLRSTNVARSLSFITTTEISENLPTSTNASSVSSPVKGSP